MATTKTDHRVSGYSKIQSQASGGHKSFEGGDQIEANFAFN